MALLGPNGAGKTTFLLALMGLIKHRRGKVRSAASTSPAPRRTGSPPGTPASSPRAGACSPSRRSRTT